MLFSCPRANPAKQPIKNEIIKSAKMGRGDCFPRHGDLGKRSRGWRWREDEGGCRSVVGEGLLQPFVTRDGETRCGERCERRRVAVGDPTERVGMLLADPPALSNSERMGEQEGGEQISPATEGSALCPAPFQAKYSGKGRAGAAHPRSSPFWLEKPFPPGLSFPKAVEGWEPPLSGAHPIVQAPCPKVTKKAEEQPSEEAAPDSLSPAELISAVLLADAAVAPGDGGLGCGRG